MLKKIIIFNLISFGFIFSQTTNYSITEPELPDLPQINDIEEPQFEYFQPNYNTNYAYIYNIPGKVLYSDNKILEGILFFSNNILFVITNFQSNKIDIYNITLYDINKIKILRWKPYLKDKDLYLFVPDLYEIYNNRNTFPLIISNNIEILNSFIITINEKKYSCYTVFYDRWIKAKNNKNRWENSLSFDFKYNFTNPIEGVVKEIIFFDE